MKRLNGVEVYLNLMVFTRVFGLPYLRNGINSPDIVYEGD